MKTRPGSPPSKIWIRPYMHVTSRHAWARGLITNAFKYGIAHRVITFSRCLVKDVESARVDIYLSSEKAYPSVPHLVLVVAVPVCRDRYCQHKMRYAGVYAVSFRKLYGSTQPSHSPHPSLINESKAIVNKLMNLLVLLARDVVVPPLACSLP